MKTPDEIKKGMTCCLKRWKDDHLASCHTECPYRSEGVWCRNVLMADIKAWNKQLESRLAQVERERDAAEHDLHLLADGEGACNVCARFDEGYIPTPPHCRYACDDDCFRWRGVCAENTKEEK